MFSYRFRAILLVASLVTHSKQKALKHILYIYTSIIQVSTPSGCGPYMVSKAQWFLSHAYPDWLTDRGWCVWESVHQLGQRSSQILPETRSWNSLIYHASDEVWTHDPIFQTDALINRKVVLGKHRYRHTMEIQSEIASAAVVADP